MAIVWGTKGDWYVVDYTVGDDPTMRNAKYKIQGGRDGMIEGQILPLLAARHKCDISKIGIYGHINRVVQ